MLLNGRGASYRSTSFRTSAIYERISGEALMTELVESAGGDDVITSISLTGPESRKYCGA